MTRVTVVGTTSWGTTLGILLARHGVPVTLLARTPGEAEMLAREGENRRLLPGAAFPHALSPSADAAEALEGAELVILATPAQRLRENLSGLRPHVGPDTVFLSAIKGLELDTGLLMTQVLQAEIPGAELGRAVVLSGPNLSREVVEDKPSSAVIACQDPGVAEWVQELYNTPTFRVYTNEDIVGVELGGALKNVIGIAAGISDGLGYGANAKAALVTRGLAEVTRLGVACGARPLTLSGLSGLGDMAATCFSNLSRNRFVGEQVGMGLPLPQVIEGMVHVAEGVDTIRAALLLAERHGIEMPITEITSRILFDGVDPREATAWLLNRTPGQEWPSALA